MGYALYRRRRKGRGSRTRSTVSYRRVDVKQGDDGRENVLVIGAQGSFGQHLVKELLEDGGYNVHSLDAFIPYPEDRSDSICSYVQADVCCYEDMLLCARGMQSVFHAGSLSPHDQFVKEANFHQVNVTGTENIVQVCRECGVKRLIYTSSTTVVVGRKWNKRDADETVPYPKSHRNVYTASLASAEQVVLNSNGKDGLATCALRLAPVTCTPNDPFVESLLTQTMFLVKNSSHGLMVASADTSAKAHILAEKKLRSDNPSIAAGKTYNLCGKLRVTYSNFVGMLATDSETTIWGQPPPTEVSNLVLTLLAYINYYCYKMSGVLLLSKTVSPLMLDIHTTELSFSSARAHRELGWMEEGEWQDVVARMVQARQETKKDQ